MAAGPDAVLQELERGGFSVLAAGVEGLRPQKTEPIPSVLEHQQRYARVPSSLLTATFTGSLLITAPLPPNGTVQVAVTFDIVQAPSAFSLPVMQKRPWDPPFQVRMTWRSALPLQFSTTVAAFVADEAAVPSMLTWQLPSAGDAAKALLEHQQERMVVLTPLAAQTAGGPTKQEPVDSGMEGGGGGGGGGLPSAPREHYAEAVFTFSKLQFGAPSQMRPRWLVFAASLLGGGCVYSHYKVPTVVMSRLAEQFEKAKAVLWGSQDPPSCDSSVMKMDHRQLRKYIKRELSSIDIQREPSEEDQRYLAARAGFVAAPAGGGKGAARGAPHAGASLEELASFKQWFAGHLVMLKHVRLQYERCDPQVICGFGTTREQAEALLASHPTGTFLLRFGSQGGQLVLSVRGGRTSGGAGAGAGVTHYAIPCSALQRNGLEVLLERNGKAEQLLDASTGRRHLRTAVLDRSYLQAVDMEEARKRYRGGSTLRERLSDEAESSPSSSDPHTSLMAGYQQQLPMADPPGLMHLEHNPSTSQQQQQQQQQLLAGGPSGTVHSVACSELNGANRVDSQSQRSVGGHMMAQQAQQHMQAAQQAQQAQQHMQAQMQQYHQQRQQQQQQQQQPQGYAQLRPPPASLTGTGSGQPSFGGEARASVGTQDCASPAAGHASEACGMPAHAPGSLMAEASAYNPYSGAGLLQHPGGGSDPGFSSFDGLHTWALLMGAPLGPARAAHQQQLMLTQQQAAAQQAQQSQQSQQPFNWSSPGLVPMLSVPGGQPETGVPAGLAAWGAVSSSQLLAPIVGMGMGVQAPGAMPGVPPPGPRSRPSTSNTSSIGPSDGSGTPVGGEPLSVAQQAQQTQQEPGAVRRHRSGHGSTGAIESMEFAGAAFYALNTAGGGVAGAGDRLAQSPRAHHAQKAGLGGSGGGAIHLMGNGVMQVDPQPLPAQQQQQHQPGGQQQQQQQQAAFWMQMAGPCAGGRGTSPLPAVLRTLQLAGPGAAANGLPPSGALSPHHSTGTERCSTGGYGDSAGDGGSGLEQPAPVWGEMVDYLS